MIIIEQEELLPKLKKFTLKNQYDIYSQDYNLQINDFFNKVDKDSLDKTYNVLKELNRYNISAPWTDRGRTVAGPKEKEKEKENER